MHIEQWAIFFFISLLLTSKAPNHGAFILFVAYWFYINFIVDLSPSFYYSCSALLNLMVGLALNFRNKNAAICSYSLVPLNILGYILWYKYYPPTIYDNIALLILALQLATITPRGILDGSRSNIQYFMAKLAVFNRIKARVTIHKRTKKKEIRQ